PVDSVGDEGAPLAPMRDFVAAVGVLTRLPVSQPDPKSAAFGRCTRYFPLVGLCIGTLLAGLYWLLPARLSRWIVASLVVLLWDTVMRFSERERGKGEVAGVMDSSRPRPFALAMSLAVVKMIALAVPGTVRPAAPLFSPMLACWG